PTRLEGPAARRARAEEEEQEAAGRPELTSFLAPAEAPDEIGRLGPYRVLEGLGSGGMGGGVKAEARAGGRRVARERALPDRASGEPAGRRFPRGAKAGARVPHDRIVPIYHVGEGRGVPFTAMPLLGGETLDARLRHGTLPLEEVLR